MLILTQDEKEEVVANCDHLIKLKYSPVLPAQKKRPIEFITPEDT
jgi:hypothetical protein